MFQRWTKVKDGEVRLKPGVDESAQQVVANQANSTLLAANNERIYAGFWQRVAADIIDWLILTVAGLVLVLPALSMVLYYIVLPKDAIALLNQPYAVICLPILGLMFAFGVLLPWLYVACYESSRWQGTFGKIFLGLKVTDIDGRNIGFFKSTLKVFLVLVLTGTPFWIASLLMLFPMFKETNVAVICLTAIGVLAPILFVLYMLCNEKRQTVYDKLAKRLVVVNGKPQLRMIAISVIISVFTICTTRQLANQFTQYVKTKSTESADHSTEHAK